MAYAEYQLRNEAEAARDLLAALADTLGDDDEARTDMAEGETELFEAVERAIGDIRECDVVDAGCQLEIEKLIARRDRARARRDHVRAAIEQAMVTAGLDKIPLATKTLTLTKRAGKAVITDEAAIPADFWAPQPPKLDKAALAEALKDGPVAGATLSNGSVSLQIRSK